MPDFLQAVLNNLPYSESPLRRRLIIAVVIGAVIAVLVGITAVVTIGRRSNYTPDKAAQAMCTGLAPNLKSTNTANLTDTLPDVGSPAAVIVVPGCLKNTHIAFGEPGHYSTEINVYVLVTPNQLIRLLHAGSVSREATGNTPYSAPPVTLGHLLSPKLMEKLATGARSTKLNYFVTDGPAPSQELTKTHGYPYLTAPYNALTGMRYAAGQLPFRQLRDATPNTNRLTVLLDK
jgi:hypothetical protein